MSNIDRGKPVYGQPTTQSVRDNFAIAADEIDALRNDLTAVQTGYLPLLGGGNVTGDVSVSGLLRSGSPSGSVAGLQLLVADDTGTEDVEYWVGNKLRWAIARRGAETGASAGSTLDFIGNDDAGTPWTAISMSRAGGLITLAGDPVAPLGAATKQYADHLLVNPLLTASPTTQPVTMREVGYVATLPAWPTGTMLVIARETGDQRAQLITAGGANILLGHAAEGTMSAPTATQINRQMLSLQGGGFDGAAWVSAASIIFLTPGPWTTGSHPSALTFQTTAAGTTAGVERMRLSDTGSLLISATAPVAAEKLRVVGGANIDSLTMTGPIIVDSGIGPLVVQGSAAGLSTAFRAGTLVDLVGRAGDPARLNIDAFQNGPGTSAAAIVSGRYAAGTPDNPGSGGPTPAGRVLLGLTGLGWGATGYAPNSRAQINLLTAEAWSDTAQGTYVAFNTTPNGTVLTAEAMRIANNGALLIGATLPVGPEKFRVVGGANIDALTVSGAILVTPGTAPLVIAPVGMPTAAFQGGTLLEITAPAATNARVVLDAFAAAGILAGRGAQGAPTAPAAVNADQTLLGLQAFGFGQTAYTTTPRAAVNLRSAQPWTDAAQGTYIQFQTAPIGGATMTERLRVTDAGALQFAVTGPSISVGVGVPAGAAAAGSIFIRTDGAAGSRIYINQNGAVSWAAIAAV